MRGAMKSRNRPKQKEKKPKQKYKKAERGSKFNPWIYRYFDVKADFKEDKDG
jgi:hypothetical protein